MRGKKTEEMMRHAGVTECRGREAKGMGGQMLGQVAGSLLGKIPGVGGVLGPLASMFGGMLPFEKGGKVKDKDRKKKSHGGDVKEEFKEVNRSGGKAKVGDEFRGGARKVNGRKKMAMGGVGKERKGELY